MLMASYFLNKVTCTNSVVIFWKLTEEICIFKNFAVSCHFIKVKKSIFHFSICHPYVRTSQQQCNIEGTFSAYCLKYVFSQTYVLSSRFTFIREIISRFFWMLMGFFVNTVDDVGRHRVKYRRKYTVICRSGARFINIAYVQYYRNSSLKLT